MPPTPCFAKGEMPTAFMLLGHGCDWIDEPECIVPPNWVYATSITCGNQLDALSTREFEYYFFHKHPNIFDPCTHYDALNKQLMRTRTDTDHKFGLHIGNHKRRKTYINNRNTFLDESYYDADQKLCKSPKSLVCEIYRSGLYLVRPDTPKHTLTHTFQPSVLTRLSPDQPYIITENDIHHIYRDAVFPFVIDGKCTFTDCRYILQVLDHNIRTTRLYQYANAEETAYFYTDFLEVLNKYVFTQCPSIKHLFFHLFNMYPAGVLYMMSCRGPCSEKDADHTIAAIAARRDRSSSARKSLEMEYTKRLSEPTEPTPAKRRKLTKKSSPKSDGNTRRRKHKEVYSPT